MVAWTVALMAVLKDHWLDNCKGYEKVAMWDISSAVLKVE